MQSTLSKISVKKSAFVVPVNDKFACVAGHKLLGSSKNPRHFEYHFRLGKPSKKFEGMDIQQFVYLDQQGHVDHINDCTAKTNENLKALKHDARLVIKDLQALLIKPH